MTGSSQTPRQPHSLRGRQADGRRHLRLPSGPQETSTLADEVTFPEAFSQGFFFKVPAHFKAFRANYAKVHGKAIKETCTAGKTHPRAETPESSLPSQTSGGRAPHGRTVRTEGGAGGAKEGAEGQPVRAARHTGSFAGEAAGRLVPGRASGLDPGLRRAHTVPTSSGENEHITPAQGPGTPRGDQTEPGSSRHPNPARPSQRPKRHLHPHRTPTSSLLLGARSGPSWGKAGVWEMC